LREKIVFVSEIGEYIPGILWRPRNAGSPVILIADSAGKAAVAESGLVEPLLRSGHAVFAVDLRGRGETLGRRGAGKDSNYHFASHSIMWGRPLAGARAFDVTRAADYISTRRELSGGAITAVGLGDDALPVMLAASVDRRIARVACAGFDLGFRSEMIEAAGKTPREVLRIWNSSVMNYGRLNDGASEADCGSVVPGILRVMDVPDFAALLGDRRLLFAAARNAGPAAARSRAEWERLSSAANLPWFVPGRRFGADLLLEWLRGR
jgi:hypothetical protein